MGPVEQSPQDHFMSDRNSMNERYRSSFGRLKDLLALIIRDCYPVFLPDLDYAGSGSNRLFPLSAVSVR